VVSVFFGVAVVAPAELVAELGELEIGLMYDMAWEF